MSNLETREFEARADIEERTITGLAVPYGETANIGGDYVERFAPGAIRSIDDVKIFYGHAHDDLPIGKVISGRETDAGYEITAKLTAGVQRADETLALMRDSVLNKFSVGFIPVNSTKDGQTITRNEIDLKEISVVAFPAYSGATINEVREEAEASAEDLDELNEKESTPMSDNIELDVRTALDEVAELRRVVEAGLTVATPTVAVEKFRSQGEFAKALVAGDEDAKMLARTATTSSDTVALPGFLGYVDKLIANNRPTVSAFSRAALPASGLTVEYAAISSNTIAVGEQDPENEALAFGNLAIDTVSAAVKTYGGYTSFSRQTIERSSVPFLNAAFTALSVAYATATNAALVAKLASLTWTGKVFDCDGGTAASLIEGIANGASYIQAQTGLAPEFIIAAPDAYVKIMTVAGGDGRPVINVDGAGVNNVGSGNIPGLRGQVLGLPIIVDPALATGVVYMANSAAVQTLESAGSPVRLTDGDITTLTDSISVYGYAAVTIPFEGAIVKLDVTA
jgi:HK97 family phage prohead protease